MFENVKIESKYELPYKLIDIREGSEQFILSFIKFDEGQTEYSVKNGGVTGNFEVSYICSGINSKFECDVTTGNLYSFYLQLENVYECLPGIEPVAVLENYGSLNRTKLTFEFDKKGHAAVSGQFLNKETLYKSGVLFEIQIDTFGVVTEILNSLKEFFEELKRIQGHNNFY